MRVTVEIASPEVLSTTSASLILRDPESGLSIAEIAIRGAGYVVLTEKERQEITEIIHHWFRPLNSSSAEISIPDRDGGYLREIKTWEEVAAASAEKRAASKSGGVVKVGGRKVSVPLTLEDINYPEGAKFDADGIVIVPSRKGEDADMKRFRRACKRAKASQMAFLAAQKDPSSVEEGEADEEIAD